MSLATLVTGRTPAARRRPEPANVVDRQKRLDIARALYLLKCHPDSIARAYGCSRRSVYNWASAALAYPEWAQIVRDARAS